VVGRYWRLAIPAAAIVGVLPLLGIAAIYRLFDVPLDTALIYTVGFPYYLVLFIVTFFVHGGDEDSLTDY
jgi:hypothetical protein